MTNSSTENDVDQVTRLTLDALTESGWKRVPREPTDGLLMSIAVRLDHGLGVPGYYDQGFLVSSGGETHEERLQNTLALARDAHKALLGVNLSDASDLTLEPLQKKIAMLLGGLNQASIFDAVRQVTTDPDFVLVPTTPLPEMISAVSRVLEQDGRQKGIPDDVSEAQLQRMWKADAVRICEEVSGAGFYRAPSANQAAGEKNSLAKSGMKL